MKTYLIHFMRGLLCLAMLTLAPSATAQETHVPLLMKVIWQADKSVSDEFFETERQVLAGLMEKMAARAHAYPLQRPDHVSVSTFGSPEQFSEMKFVECSNTRDMAYLYATIGAMPHPKYSEAAIYQTLYRAAHELTEHAELLPGAHVGVLVLLTTGQDTASIEQARKWAEAFFPRQRQMFFVVLGLGENEALNDLEPLADHVGRIARPFPVVNINNYY